MQIHSLTTTHHCSSPSYRLNGDLGIHHNSNCRIPDILRAQHECLAGKKPTLPNPNRTLRTPNPVCSWRDRVLELFDPALQDAEDLMLSLPYADIREKTHSFATTLDWVALSDLEGAANRHMSDSRISTKTKGNRNTPPVTCAAIEGRKRAMASGGSSVARQHYDSPTMTKAMYVTLASLPIDVDMLTTPSYRCYESLVAVIVSYNQSLGYETEMQARRALTAALAAMDNIS